MLYYFLFDFYMLEIFNKKHSNAFLLKNREPYSTLKVLLQEFNEIMNIQHLAHYRHNLRDK
jgi:hypothetical protein